MFKICIENLQNTTPTDWINVGSCQITDQQNQSRNWTQYDFNECGTYENETFIEYQLIECNYCSYSTAYTDWTDWIDTTCINITHRNQSRTRIEYDENYDTCYAVTGLESDLWNNGVNLTHYEYQAIEDENCNPMGIMKKLLRGVNVITKQEVWWLDNRGNLWLKGNLNVTGCIIYNGGILGECI
jgi:hypothetical protein